MGERALCALSLGAYGVRVVCASEGGFILAAALTLRGGSTFVGSDCWGVSLPRVRPSLGKLEGGGEVWC